MALRVCVANGNWTDAATWATVDSTYLMGTSGYTTLTTSDQASANFTPGDITIDAIYLKINSVGTSPTASSTVTVTLYNATDAAAVVSLSYNTAELPADGVTQHAGWICFKLDASYLLVAGKNYNIRLKVAATASQPSISFQTNGTANNWAHMLRIPGTTGAPSAGDQMFICGELAPAATWTTRTVTMNETATTDYGTNANSTQNNSGGIEIGKNGTLTWGTSAATNYNLRLSGQIFVYHGGTMNMGTVATPCPRDSTMTLEFDTALSKTYSIIGFIGSTIVMQGQSRTAGKNIWRSLISSTASSGQTTVNVSDDTGWKSGDLVYLTPTDAINHAERITLNGDAGASSLTATSNLSNNHTIVDHKWAYACLLTRNVVFKSLGTSYGGQIYAYGALNLDWVQIDYGAVAFYNAVDEKALDYVSFRGTGSGANGCFYTLNSSAADKVRIRNCLLYVEPHSQGIVIDNEDTNDYTLTSIIVIGNNTLNTAVSFAGNYGANTSIDDIQTFGFGGTGFRCELGNSSGNYIEGTSTMPSNIKSLQCTYGFRLCSSYYPICGAVFTGYTACEGTGTGGFIGLSANAGGFYNCDFVDLTIINQGSTTANGINLEGPHINTRIINPTIKTNSTRNGSYAITLGTPATNQTCCYLVTVIGGSLSDGTSPYQDNSTGIFTYPGATYGVHFEFKFRGVSFGSAPAIFATTNDTKIGRDSHYSRDGSADDVHELKYIKRGVIAYETTTYRTTSPSMKMSPLSATVKLGSKARHVPVVDGAAAKTISIYMRKNSGYNGNQPRIVLKRNAQLGVTTDTVIATANLVAQDTWYEVSGALPVATDDGIYEVYVDCDGTAGSVFVDDWTVT